jgi:hypothetical protein
MSKKNNQKVVQEYYLTFQLSDKLKDQFALKLDYLQNAFDTLDNKLYEFREKFDNIYTLLKFEKRYKIFDFIRLYQSYIRNLNEKIEKIKEILTQERIVELDLYILEDYYDKSIENFDREAIDMIKIMNE